MSLVDKNAVLVEEREKEIVAIVQSISEINEMYRDLATMVVDQVRPYHHRLGFRFHSSPPPPTVILCVCVCVCVTRWPHPMIGTD